MRIIGLLTTLLGDDFRLCRIRCDHYCPPDFLIVGFAQKQLRLVKNMTGYTNFLGRNFGAWVCFDRWSCRSSLTSRRMAYTR